MHKKTIFSLVIVFLLVGSDSLFSQTKGIPNVLSIRERARVINTLTKMRLDEVLPKVMGEADFDMWIILQRGQP